MWSSGVFKWCADDWLMYKVPELLRNWVLLALSVFCVLKWWYWFVHAHQTYGIVAVFGYLLCLARYGDVMSSAFVHYSITIILLWQHKTISNNAPELIHLLLSVPCRLQNDKSTFNRHFEKYLMCMFNYKIILFSFNNRILIIKKIKKL